MDFNEARTLVKKMKLDSSRSLTFKAAVIIFLCTSTGKCEAEEIQTITGYQKGDIAQIIDNLRQNKILVGDTLYMESLDDDKNIWVEFTLIAMAGGGKIVRHSADTDSSNDMLPAVIYNFPFFPAQTFA